MIKIDTMTGAALAFAGFALWFISKPKQAAALAEKTALLSNGGPGFSTMDAQHQEVQAATAVNMDYTSANMPGNTTTAPRYFWAAP